MFSQGANAVGAAAVGFMAALLGAPGSHYEQKCMIVDESTSIGDESALNPERVL